MMKGRLKWGAIIAVAVLIVVMAPSDNESRDAKTSHSERQTSGSAANSERTRTHEAGHVELYRLEKLELLHKEKNKVGDAFNTNSWDDVPAILSHSTKVVEIAPPAVIVPTAPPLPFTYLGRYGDTATRTIILSKGERVYTVVVGDVIENTYRVEKFTSGTINLTYLPLGIEQHLPTGEAL